MLERTVSAAGIFWTFILCFFLGAPEISGDANLGSNNIYTDKEIYGTGETVHIGVPHFDAPKNVSTVLVSMVIRDSKSNIIWEKKDSSIFLQKFISHRLRIGTHANPGKWNIEMVVTSSNNSLTNKTSRKEFEVRAVGAPRFSIQISPTYNFMDNRSASYGSLNKFSASLEVAVRAVHDSGAGVIGRCELTLRIVDDCGNGFLPEIFPELTSEFEIAGLPTMHSVNVTRYIANDKNEARKNLRDIGGIFEIVLKVTDKFTGQAVTEVARTSFSRDGLTIREFSSFRVRRPGLDFIADFRLLDQAGNIVKVDKIYEFRPFSVSSKANFRQGIGRISITGDESSYSLSSKLENRKVALQRNITNIANGASDYLQIRLLDMATNEISQNAPFKVQVMSTNSIDAAQIVIYSGGKLIFSETRNQNSKKFEIDATFPENSWREATLAVFAKASGKILSDAISLKVANWVQKSSTDVGLSVSADIAEPGENVSVTIKAKPGSVIYLHAEDSAFEDPDEFASEKWLQSESGFKSGGTNDLVIGDRMNNEQIARILANQVEKKRETDENPTCKNKPREFDPRRRVWMSKIIKVSDANGTTTELFQVPEAEGKWRMKGFVVVEESTGKSGRRIEFLPSASVKVVKPISIHIELPVFLVENEKISVPVLIPQTSEDPKNVESVRIVTQKSDANDSKTENCTKMAGTTELKYACPMQFTRIGHYSIMVEAKVNGTLQRSTEKFLHVNPPGREKFSMAAATLQALPATNHSPTSMVRKILSGMGVPPCLITLVGNETSRISKEDEIPLLTLSSDLMAVVGEYTEDRPESSFPGASLESSLLKMVANTAILKYLNAAGLNEDSHRLKAEKNLGILHQNVISFKREDGSFAEFGGKSSNSSIWLTAWAVQTLIGAKNVTFVDENVIRGGLNFLKNRTESSFVGRHPGASMHLDDAKNDPKDLALAAYVMVTFLKASEFDDQKNNYNGTIEKARKYLRNNFNTSDASFYAKTLIAYSAHVWIEMNPGGRSGSSRYIKALWESPLGNYTPAYKELTTTRLRVEFHSYMVLMNYYRKFDINVVREGNQILRGLKSPSGFVTAFDTATAILALAKVAERERHFLANYTISVNATGLTNSTVMLESQSFTSELDSKKYVLPRGTKQVCIDGTGQGFIFAQLEYSYYIGFKNISGRHFHLTFDVELTNQTDLKMKFSTRNKVKSPSKMAVAEVNLPSGYNFLQPQTDSELRNVSSVKTWEYLDGNSKLEIYFESVPQDVSIDFNLFAGKSLEVAHLARASVRIYQFANPARVSQVIYGIPGVSM